MAKSNKQITNQKVNHTTPISNTVATAEQAAFNTRWWILAVLMITAFCFFPTLDNQFVNWDDDVNLLENDNTAVLDAAHIKAIFTDRVIGNYNPLPILTLAIERHFVGLEPRLYHIDNLLLHLLATFFVFLIFKKLGIKDLGAAAGALLFGIHPMRVESVAWVTERKDVLMAAFYFPAIYYYIKSVQLPEKRNKYLIITAILFLFSLLSKIQSVALPLTMLVIDYFLDRKFDNKSILEKVPFFILSAIVGSVGIFFLKDNGSLQDVASYTLFDRLLIGMYSLNVYLIKVIFPYQMSPLYPYPATLDSMFYIAPLGVAAFFGLIYWLWKQDKKAWVFGLVFFFFNVMFLLQVLGAGQAFLADRFTYIPYLGLFFIVAYYINDFFEKNNTNKNLLLGIVGAFLLFSAFKTRQQNDVWQDGGTLWTKALEYYPDSDLPWGNRARFYRENKRDYLKALEDYNQAIRLKPKAEALNSRGKTYFDLVAYPDLMQKLKISTATECTKRALDDYNAALKLDTTKVEAKTLGEIYANRGAAYGRYSEETGDKSYLQQSQSDLNNAMRLDPKNENCFLNGYLVNAQLNNLPRALECIDKYNILKPGESDMYYERGITHRRMNQDDEAIKDFQQAIQLAQNELRSKEPKLQQRGKMIVGVCNNELARIYFKNNDLTNAKTYILEAQRYEFKGIDANILNAIK